MLVHVVKLGQVRTGYVRICQLTSSYERLFHFRTG
jgi:hypothetical protein